MDLPNNITVDEIQLYIDREQSNAYKLHIKKFTGEIVGIFIFLFTCLHTIRCARKKRWKCEEIEGFYWANTLSHTHCWQQAHLLVFLSCSDSCIGNIFGRLSHWLLNRVLFSLRTSGNWAIMTSTTTTYCPSIGFQSNGKWRVKPKGMGTQIIIEEEIEIIVIIETCLILPPQACIWCRISRDPWTTQWQINPIWCPTWICILIRIKWTALILINTKVDPFQLFNS